MDLSFVLQSASYFTYFCVTSQFQCKTHSYTDQLFCREVINY